MNLFYLLLVGQHLVLQNGFHDDSPCADYYNCHPQGTWGGSVQVVNISLGGWLMVATALQRVPSV